MRTIRYKDNFLALSKASGLSNNKLAKELHIAHRTIESWTYYDRLPQLTILSVVAEYFGVSLDTLVYGSEEEVLTESRKGKRCLTI